jgi:phosphonate metabolism-associated iron-containing alcohol dehydrogenase
VSSHSVQRFGDWEFFNPVRILFGAGAVAQLPRQLRGEGRLLVVASPGLRRRGDLDRILALYRASEEPLVIEDVAANPDLSDLEKRLAELRASSVREIVAIGGGSVMDTAKVLALGLGHEDFSPRLHVLEGAPIPARRKTRLVCVPTTAGTGSEVTPFATVWDRQSQQKYSVAGDGVFPDAAVLDPELTLALPWPVTVATGLDALTQAFEATWSRRANPVSSAFAVRAIRLGLDALAKLRERPHDLSLRGAMQQASLFSGLAISRSRTALCHSMSYAITAAFGVPHGLACGFTLPEVFAFNREAEPQVFETLAAELGYSGADALHGRLLALMSDLHVGELLRPYVGDGAGLEALAPKMLAPGRADNNVRSADLAAVRQLLLSARRSRGLALPSPAEPEPNRQETGNRKPKTGSRK